MKRSPHGLARRAFLSQPHPAPITCAQAPFVTSVTVIDPAGVETTVWNDTDTTPCGGALVVSLAGDRLVKQVRVHTQATSWEAIDAV